MYVRTSKGAGNNVTGKEEGSIPSAYITALCFYGQKKAGQILENIYSEEVINKKSGFDVRVVTLTMGDKLSGETAAFAAREVEEAPAQ